ncbi:MAG: hypothetical protein FWC96_07910 [Oscillospiraceae bacterium]|nr:hypothetical protein [Oscillospiraceae bacterium]
MDIKPCMRRFGFGHRASKHIVVEQGGKLWLAFASEGAGTFMMSEDSQAAGLFELSTLYDGKDLPYTYSATESMVEITTEKGHVRIAIDAEAAALRIEAEGVNLRFDSKEATRQLTTLNTAKGVSVNIGGGRYFFVSRKGKMAFDDTWLLKEFHSAVAILDVSPENGKIDLIAYDLPGDMEPPEIIKTIDECAKINAAELKAFNETLLPTPAEWDDLREKIAYLMWLSHKEQPSGTEVILQNKLRSNATTASAQSLVSLAFAEATTASEFIVALPPEGLPAQGFAILRMFARDAFQKVSRSTVFKLYDVLNMQALWWLENRTGDDPNLHFYAYRHEAESPAAKLFKSGEPVAAPDLNAYIILLCEAAARLSEHIRITADAVKWRNRLNLQKESLIANLWDGEDFHGMNIYTGEKSEADTPLQYMPLILGKMLPVGIAGKLAEKIENDILDYDLGVFIVFGLYDAGYDKVAKRIVTAALKQVRAKGIHCPLYGAQLIAMANSVLM